MKTITFSSTGNHYDALDAYNSAYDNITLINYHIVGTESDSYYCEGCNDYHYWCSITVERRTATPTDLEVLLRNALDI
jgi:hypothetical protein